MENDDAAREAAKERLTMNRIRNLLAWLGLGHRHCGLRMCYQTRPYSRKTLPLEVYRIFWAWLDPGETWGVEDSAAVRASQPLDTAVTAREAFDAVNVDVPYWSRHYGPGEAVVLDRAGRRLSAADLAEQAVVALAWTPISVDDGRAG